MSGITLFLVLGAFFIIYVLALFDFHWSMNKSEEDELGLRISPEAMSYKNNLGSEFEKLVADIAYYNARSNEKLQLRACKEGELKDKVLISPEDMNEAFLEAIDALYVENLFPTECNRESSLERIKRLRKLYEPQTP